MEAALDGVSGVWTTSDDLVIELDNAGGNDTSRIYITGWTVVPASITIRAAAGSEHDGKISGSGGYTLRPTSAGVSPFRFEMACALTLERFRIACFTDYFSDQAALDIIGDFSRSNPVTLNGMILRDDEDDTPNDCLRVLYPTFNVTLNACQIHGSSRHGIHILANVGTPSGTFTLRNCGIGGHTQDGIHANENAYSSISVVSYNTYSVSNGSDDWGFSGAGGSAGTFSGDSNFSEDSTAPGTNATTGAAITTSLSPGAGTWIIVENNTAGSEDWRLVDDADNDALAAGDSANAPSVDFLGTSYASIADIGPHLVSAASDPDFITDLPLESIEITGNAPSLALTEDKQSNIPLGAIEIQGYAPSLSLTEDKQSNIPLGALNIQGYAPALSLTEDKQSNIPLGALNVQGYAPAPSLTEDKQSNIPLGTLEIQGYVPGVTIDADILTTLPIGALESTGYAPSLALTEDKQSNIPLGPIEIQGVAPGISIPGDEIVDIPVGALLIQGFSPLIIDTSADQGGHFLPYDINISFPERTEEERKEAKREKRRALRKKKKQKASEAKQAAKRVLGAEKAFQEAIEAHEEQEFSKALLSITSDLLDLLQAQELLEIESEKPVTLENTGELFQTVAPRLDPRAAELYREALLALARHEAKTQASAAFGETDEMLLLLLL
jgi:hypothetical protein